MIFSLLRIKLLDIINQLPGEQFPPHPFPGMDAWQIEYAIDYSLHDECDESENTYFLMFKLSEDNNTLQAAFSLQRFVQNVGTAELAVFPIERTEDWVQLLVQNAEKYYLHKDAVPSGILFINSIIPFLNKVSGLAQE